MSKKIRADSINDSFQFLFPTVEQRKAKLPSVIAQKYSDASHYLFFYNGLTSRGEIRRFLRAQPLETLDQFAAAYDIESLDLVSQKRRREGTSLSDKDRPLIIKAIMDSVTT